VSFARRQRLVRNEHDSKLAYDRIEYAIRKRQATRVGLQPPHVFIFRKLAHRVLKHRFVQVSRSQFHARREMATQDARDNAGTAGQF
jgi:hypothetical protein